MTPWGGADDRSLLFSIQPPTSNLKTTNRTMSTTTDDQGSYAWWRYLDKYHWFVFAMAALAWMFDCFDQQIFILFATRLSII